MVWNTEDNISDTSSEPSLCLGDEGLLEETRGQRRRPKKCREGIKRPMSSRIGTILIMTHNDWEDRRKLITDDVERRKTL